MNNDHEGALGGLNELEIFGSINSRYNACAQYTNIEFHTDYYWNIDSYLNTIATALPLPGYKLLLKAYEDDNERCVIHTSDDDYMGQSLLALSEYPGAHLTSSGSHDFVFEIAGGNP
jgi:hypothetical protein